MSKRIPRLELDQLPADLAAALRPRVDRLGYLGEFFKAAAQQPAALGSFMQLTDDLKEALPEDVTEVVALTVAGVYDNSYERHQHERLCRKLGFDDAWIRAVEALGETDAAALLSPAQTAAQRLTLAALARRGLGVEAVFEDLIDAVGPAQAMAVLLLVGRYVTHSLVVNVLGLAPPVPSIFDGPGRHESSPLWISEDDVRSLLSLDEAIVALEDGLRREARGAATNMVKTHASWGRGNTLHAIGAVFPAEAPDLAAVPSAQGAASEAVGGTTAFAGTKSWAHTERGAAPIFALFDADNGARLALIEAFGLGQRRTGGISAVATRWLAPEDADDLAIVGSGRQALMQVRAVAAVRKLRRVRVFSPTPAHRAAFVRNLRASSAFEVVEAASVEATLEGAPLVTLVTRATQAFVEAGMIARGAHVNAVGAITLNRAEFDPVLLGRCGLVVADSVPAVHALSSEFRGYYESRSWDGVKSLCDVVAGRVSRPPNCDVTLFKAMGMGISDLSLGVEIYRRALERGLGRRI